MRSTQPGEATVRQSQEMVWSGHSRLRLEGVMSVVGQDQVEWGFALAVTSQKHCLELFSSPGSSKTEYFGWSCRLWMRTSSFQEQSQV